MFIDLMLLPKKPCSKYYVHIMYVVYNMYVRIILRMFCTHMHTFCSCAYFVCGASCVKTLRLCTCCSHLLFFVYITTVVAEYVHTYMSKNWSLLAITLFSMYLFCYMKFDSLVHNV